MKKYAFLAVALIVSAGCISRRGIWRTVLPGPIETSAEYSRSTREVQRDYSSPRLRSLWDFNVRLDGTTRLTSDRVYGKIGTRLWDRQENHFFPSAAAFVRLGGANAWIDNFFYGSAPSYRGGRWIFGPSGHNPWTQDYNGNMGFSIGGGANATLYRQGPFLVQSGWSTNYWETRDTFTFMYPAGAPLDGPTLWQDARVRILENNIDLGCSWEIPLDGAGTIVPFGGITAGFINGDADVRFNLNNQFYDRISFGFEEDSALGLYVGTRWNAPLIKDRVWFFGSVKGTFWGDGGALTVDSGISW